MRGIPAPGMPLFSCPICGWTTTATAVQALRPHELGVPDSSGVLEQMAYAGKRLGDPLAVGERARGQAPSRFVPEAPDP